MSKHSTTDRCKEESAPILITNDIELRDKLILNNTGLVLFVVNNITSESQDRDLFEELYSVGTMGLILAATKFDTERGIRFSTYAVPVIRGTILNYFKYNLLPIHISETMKAVSKKIEGAEEEYIKNHGRSPSIDEIAAQLQMPTEYVCEALWSMDAYYPISTEDEEVGEIVDNRENGIARFIDRSYIERALCELDDHLRAVVEQTYFEDKSPREIGQEMGMSTHRVTRHLQVALNIMRAFMLGCETASSGVAPMANVR